jgi:hypothetical protein
VERKDTNHRKGRAENSNLVNTKRADVTDLTHINWHTWKIKKMASWDPGAFLMKRYLPAQSYKAIRCVFNWLTDCLTDLLTTWSRVLLENLTVPQLDKKFLTFYEIRKFITAFTTARHMSLAWPNQHSPDLSIPLLEDISWRYSTIYTKVFQEVYFLPGFLPKTCMQLSCLPFVPHVPPISFSWNMSTE